MKRNRKKGTTIAEMCVVLAVVAIVSLSVTSFTTMVAARSKVSAAKLKMVEDRQVAKIVIENWLNQMTQAEATITADGSSLTAYLPGEAPCAVTFEEDRLVASVPDASPLFYPINTLTSLEFDHMEGSNGDAIYFCTAYYELPDPNGGVIVRSFVFTVNPHIGDVYQEVAE